MSLTVSVTGVNDSKVSGLFKVAQNIEVAILTDFFEPVLGLRRARRTQPNAAQTTPGDPTRIQRSLASEEPARPRSRRHRVDPNARRGGSKIGRAAQLRPGRITLPPPQALPEAVNRGPGDAVVLEPELNSLSQSRSESRPDTEGPSVQLGEEGSWDSAEHSAHSNLVHRTMKGKGRKKASRQQEVEAERYFHDFYTRNPAAKANGWLELPHHRRLEGWEEREEDHVSAMDRAARGLIRAQRSPLVGLLPGLSSARHR